MKKTHPVGTFKDPVPAEEAHIMKFKMFARQTKCKLNWVMTMYSQWRAIYSATKCSRLRETRRTGQSSGSTSSVCIHNPSEKTGWYRLSSQNFVRDTGLSPNVFWSPMGYTGGFWKILSSQSWNILWTMRWKNIQDKDWINQSNKRIPFHRTKKNNFGNCTALFKY